MASDWNRDHDEKYAIFMCVYTMDENGEEQNTVTGFMIEDDYYLYKEE